MPADPGGEAPRVVAVVLNWCGEEDTAACLRSLAQSDYPALRVLLVDNGSPDGSGERLHRAFPSAAYLQTGANLGYTGGNNRGVERALEMGAEYVLVLNNDTLVDSRCVAALVRAARERPGTGAVAPKILYAEEPGRVWFGGGDLSRTRAMGYHRLLDRPDPDPSGGTVEEVSFLTGCCLLLPAGVVREAGGFEEDFFAYVEDAELSLRLRERGYRLLYQPAARVLHRTPRGPLRPSPFQIFHGTRNRRRLARRRLRWGERVAFALFFYPTRLVHLIRYLLAGDGARARSLLRGMTAR